MTIYIGDALETLKKLSSESVQCCVTSPPYWGIRDYGVKGQIGLELTLQEHIDILVAIFKEVRRILKPDGVLWLNYGDSYLQMSGRGFLYNDRLTNEGKERVDIKIKNHLPKKNLIGMPWRIAFALQENGWILRSEVIWHKPNAMPESAKDRPTKAHEHLFLFSKKAKYFFDIDAIKEERAGNEDSPEYRGGCYVDGENNNNVMGKRKSKGNRAWDFTRENSLELVPGKPAQHRKERVERTDTQNLTKRNPRSVWTIATQATREAHFATFPDELAARCILSGSRPGDTILDPFLGSGTTYEMANGLGREAIGIELNPEYAEIARKRVGMFVEVVGI